MEIDDATLKAMIIRSFKTFKAFETELLAHQATLLAAKATLADANIPEDVEGCLQVARNSSEIALVVSQKYDEVQKRLLKAIDERLQDEAFAELLRSWKPKDPPS
jgi:hemoglobin-like flavoprotein